MEDQMLDLLQVSPSENKRKEKEERMGKKEKKRKNVRERENPLNGKYFKLPSG